MPRIEFVTRAIEDADRLGVEELRRYGDHRAQSRWNYFTCPRCHRRMRYQRSATGGKPRSASCERPDCAIEAARWQLHWAIEQATNAGNGAAAAFLRTLLNEDALMSGDVTRYAGESR